MTYIAGALAGLILGGAVGYLKNLFVWQKYLRESENANIAADSLSGLYARAFISYTVNILTLVAAFFVRDLFPFDGIAFLIGTAIALAVMNKVLAIRQKKHGNDSKGKEACRS